jgi:thiamine-phosphate pyrophosphorylase
VIVNDRVDLTMLSGAHGVHVGQEDLPVTQTRRLLGDEAIVGWSTHTPAQIAAAVLLPATYLAVGPVFGTTTKETGYAAVGLEMVRAARRATERPVVAIGGITLDAAPSVLAAGATAVAVIGDLLSAEDPSRRVRQYVDLLRR